MTAADPLLRVRDLSVTIDTPRGPLQAVRQIGFDLARGETLCIVGESGCGKSMTSLALMNLLPARARRDAAVLRFGDTDMANLGDRGMERLRGNRISMIFQEPMTALNPSWSIGEQLVEGVLRHESGLTRAAALDRAEDVLATCGVPDPRGRLAQYPHQLSGGLRQRVMIAMALMSSPDLLIADEPTTALDVTISAQILDLLKDIQRKLGLSVILITHDFDVVRRVADRIAVMYAGQIVEAGSRDEVLKAPAHPYTRALMACVPSAAASSPESRLGFLPGVVPSLLGEPVGCQFRERCPLAASACEGPLPWQDTDGHRSLCVFAPAEVQARHSVPVPPPAAVTPEHAQNGAAELSLHGVGQRYSLRRGLFGAQKTVHALRGIDLEIRRGEVLGLVGESGSGKSTLARALLGFETPATGAVRLRGQPIEAFDRKSLARRIQPILQDPYSSLNPRRTVAETIRLPLDIHGIGSKTERDTEVRRMMDLCGLPARTADNRPSQMSGGQRQRVAIASALILRPEVVICDEPTSALDVSVQAQILNLLKDLRAELNLTYVMISHDLNVIRAISDRVAVMYFGRLVEHGPCETMFTSPAHPYTRLLLQSTSAEAEAEPGGGHEAVVAELPDPTAPPKGCAFRSRCPRALPRCATEDPSHALTGSTHAACFNPVGVV